jgi:hypothetical protein
MMNESQFSVQIARAKAGNLVAKDVEGARALDLISAEQAEVLRKAIKGASKVVRVAGKANHYRTLRQGIVGSTVSATRETGDADDDDNTSGIVLENASGRIVFPLGQAERLAAFLPDALAGEREAGRRAGYEAGKLAGWTEATEATEADAPPVSRAG